MATYEKAKTEVLERVSRMMEKYHGELVSAEVCLDVLMAHQSLDDDGNPKGGEPVTLNGYPCQATIKIINAKDRVAGRADAEMVIDAKNWEDLSDEERDALVDHELTHLELKKDKETDKPKYDDSGRPSLKMKKHDHQFGWFDDVVRRHKEASAEAKQATDFVLTARQMWLPYLDADDPLRVMTERRGSEPESDTVSAVAGEDQDEFTERVGDALESAGVKLTRFKRKR